MKLADQIEAMRKRLVDEHQCALNDLEHLQQIVQQGDADVMRKIQEISALQSRNATDIMRSLLRVADRIGYLPSREQVARIDGALRTPPSLPDETGAPASTGVH